MSRDVLAYAATLLTSLFFMAMTVTIARTEVTLVDSVLFPRIVLGGIIILSAFGLYGAMKARDGKRPEAIHAALFIVLALILSFIILLQLAGFVIATTAFIAAFSVYMMNKYSIKNIATMTLIGFGIAWGINYIFIEILSFILP